MQPQDEQREPPTGTGKRYLQAVGLILLITGIAGLVSGIVGALRLGDIVLSGLWTGIVAILLGFSMVSAPQLYLGSTGLSVLGVLCAIVVASAAVSLYFAIETIRTLEEIGACAEVTSNYENVCNGTRYRRCYGDEDSFPDALLCLDEASDSGSGDICSCSIGVSGCGQYGQASRCSDVVNGAPSDFSLTIAFYIAVGTVALTQGCLIWCNCCCPRCLRLQSERPAEEPGQLLTTVTTRI